MTRKVLGLKVPEHIENDIFEWLAASIGPEDRQRVLKFSKRIDAVRSLLADIMVRTVLCRSLGMRNAGLNLARNKFGKQFVSNQPDCFFSKSHSGEWVVCGFDRTRLGIDVQEIRPIDFLALRGVLSTEERQMLLNLAPRDRQLAFYDIWTLKESYVKAVGKGLLLGLDTFSVFKNPKTKTIETKFVDPTCYFRQIHIDPVYRLSLCLTSFPPLEQIEEISLDDLLTGFHAVSTGKGD